PPYDDPLVIAGQGTAGREIVEDLAALGLVPDIVIANASGGGLTAGIALAVKARVPSAQVFTAEPAGFDDHPRSFASGHRAKKEAISGTICDALMAQSPGRITFEINRALVGAGVAASDAEVGRAVSFAFRELKLVVEPGGAVALAALLAGKVDVRGKIAVAVLSGGNVDPELFTRLVASPAGSVRPPRSVSQGALRSSLNESMKRRAAGRSWMPASLALFTKRR